MSAFDVSGLTDCALGEWIPSRLGAEFGAVTTHVPAGFDAYVRVFHPADPGSDELTTWAMVAQDCGTVMHATAQFHALTRGREGIASAVQPLLGNLEPAKLQALTAVLRRHTSAPDDCLFAFWEGWGGGTRPTRITSYRNGESHVRTPGSLPPDAVTPPPVGRLTLPGRNYAVFRGDLDLAGRFGSWISEGYLGIQSPNLFWPADRAWFVATEVDFDSTLVGGSAGLISDIVRDPHLEAAQLQATDRLHSDADPVNR